MADQLVGVTGWEGGAQAIRCDARARYSYSGRLADDRPMNRLSDSSLVPTSQFRAWSSYTHAAVNSNVKYVWPIPVTVNKLSLSPYQNPGSAAELYLFLPGCCKPYLLLCELRLN